MRGSIGSRAFPTSMFLRVFGNLDSAFRSERAIIGAGPARVKPPSRAMIEAFSERNVEMGGADDSRGGTGLVMGSREPVVIRQQAARLSDQRIACTLVLDRVLSPEETARFYRQPASGRPGPLDFFVEGRVVRFDCDREDEAKWRLAFEIFFVKSFRSSRPQGSRESGTRSRAGFRKLHLG